MLMVILQKIIGENFKKTNLKSEVSSMDNKKILHLYKFVINLSIK